jgi:predicted nuclease of predicted toxin-antitoxin system
VTGFLVDQQLPRALAKYLTGLGHDATHIKDYLNGTTLSDAEVSRIADAEDRIVVTKDDDFRVSHLLRRSPARLLHVTCGNISTAGLLALIDRHYPELAAAVGRYRYIEFDRPGVIIHDPS